MSHRILPMENNATFAGAIIDALTHSDDELDDYLLPKALRSTIDRATYSEALFEEKSRIPPHRSTLVPAQ